MLFTPLSDGEGKAAKRRGGCAAFLFWKSQRIFTVPIDSAVGECYNIFNQKVK